MTAFTNEPMPIQTIELKRITDNQKRRASGKPQKPSADRKFPVRLDQMLHHLRGGSTLAALPPCRGGA